MRVHSFQKELTDEGVELRATVSWEENNRSDQELFFRTDGAFAEYLTCEPQAFLVAAMPAAMHNGEQRVTLDAAVDPELLDNLHTAMRILHAWYGDQMPLLSLETQPGPVPICQRADPLTGAFLSGGLDSLALLRHNRLTYPADHPRSIKASLIVHGFDVGAKLAGDTELDVFDRALTALEPIARDADTPLIPVYTNVRHLDDDVLSWMKRYHGAALSSVGHALSGRLSDVLIASSFEIAAQQPWASHPLLDPYFSGRGLRIYHDNLRFSRLDKVRLVADWQAARENLRVCTKNPAGRLNCGDCEKCLRTMLELMAVGRLDEAPTFPSANVTAEQLAGLQFTEPYYYNWYAEMLEPLDALGRQDLTAVLKKKLDELNRRLAWEQEQDWKGTIKRFDRRYLGGNMLRGYSTARKLVRSS